MNGKFLKTGLLFGMLTPVFAFADDGGIFTPPSGDIFMSILSQIIGTLVSAAGWDGDVSSTFLGVGVDPLGIILEVLTTVGMTIAVILVIFAIIKSMLTAGTGDAKGFGKDIGGVFFILRTLYVVVMLFPIPALGGVGLGMVAVTFLFTKSVGLAGTEARAFLGVQEKISTAFNNVQGAKDIRALYGIKMPAPEVSELTYKMFEGYTCQYGLASELLYHNARQTRAELQTKGMEQSKIIGSTTDKVTSIASAADARGKVEVTPISVSAAGSMNQATTQFDITSDSAAAQVIRQQQEAEIANSQAKQQQTRVNSAIRAAQMEISGDISANNYKSQIVGTTNGSRLDAAFNALLLKQPLPSVLNGGSTVPAVSQVIPQGVFAFGAEIGNHNNACGYIDFSQTGDSRSRAHSIISNAEQYFGNSTLPANVKKAGDTLIGFTKESVRTENKLDKITQDDKNSILKIYVDLFNTKYRAEIQNLARQYVMLVNANVRTDWIPNEAGDDIREPNQENTADLMKHRQNLMTSVTKRLDTISQSLEADVISALVAGMTNKTGQDVGLQRNYVNILVKAQEEVQEKGFFTMFKFMTSIQQSIANIQNLTRIVPQYSISAASSPAESYSNFAVAAANTGLSGAQLQSRVGTYYGFLPEYAQSTTSSALYARYGQTASGDPVSPLVGLATGVDLKNLGDYYRHPMILAVETGQNMFHAIEQYEKTVAKQMAEDAKRARETKGGYVGGRENMQLTSLTGAMKGLAFVLSVLLPALPLLYGIGAVLGVLVQFFTFLFMQPFWLAAHLAPEGSKTTGKAGAGYSFLLSVVLALPALVFGFALTMVLMMAFSIPALALFADGMQILSSDVYSGVGDGTTISTSAIWASVGVLFIFALMLLMMLTKMLAIMSDIASKAPTIVGGVASSIYDYAQSIGGQAMESKVESKASAAGAASTSGIIRNGGTSGNTPMNNAQSNHVAQNPVNPVVHNAGSSTVLGGQILNASGDSNIAVNPSNNIRTQADAERYSQAVETTNIVASNSGYHGEQQVIVSQDVAGKVYKDQQAYQGIQIAAQTGGNYHHALHEAHQNSNLEPLKEIASNHQTQTTFNENQNMS